MKRSPSSQILSLASKVTIAIQFPRSGSYYYEPPAPIACWQSCSPNVGLSASPRTDIGPNMGAFAAFADPVGNEFGLYEEPRR